MKKNKDSIQQIKIDLQDLFLPEFTFIDVEDALPGVLLPNGTETLTFKDQQITPIIPLNPILFDYFTPEELIDQIQFQFINESEQPQFRVILDLPLPGLNDAKPSQNYRIIKDYPIKEENALTDVPVLEV